MNKEDVVKMYNGILLNLIKRLNFAIGDGWIIIKQTKQNQAKYMQRIDWRSPEGNDSDDGRGR